MGFKQSWLFVGISHLTKKIPIPGIKNPREIPKVKNPGDFVKIPGIKIPRLKNPNPGDKNPETQKIPNSGDFQKISKKSRCS